MVKAGDGSDDKTVTFPSFAELNLETCTSCLAFCFSVLMAFFFFSSFFFFFLISNE